MRDTVGMRMFHTDMGFLFRFSIILFSQTQILCFTQVTQTNKMSKVARQTKGRTRRGGGCEFLHIPVCEVEQTVGGYTQQGALSLANKAILTKSKEIV